MWVCVCTRKLMKNKKKEETWAECNISYSREVRGTGGCRAHGVRSCFFEYELDSMTKV